MCFHGWDERMAETDRGSRRIEIKMQTAAAESTVNKPSKPHRI